MAPIGDGRRDVDRRAAVLDAARELFAQRGFAATAMADIIAASKVSTGTVYRYFASKEDVVMTVSEGLIGIDFGADGEEGDAAPPPSSLREALDLLVKAATDEQLSRLSNQVWAQAVDSARLQQLIADRHAHVCRWLATSIETASARHSSSRPDLSWAGGAEGPGPSALQRAELVICAVSGLQERVAVGAQIDLDAFKDGLMAILDAPLPEAATPFSPAG
jgi:AcrR family transcriptional regulator